MSKYAPLQRHLAGLAVRKIRLPFAEIERILGFPLPASARAYAPWWANVGGSHVQARAWLGAGWRTCQVDIPGEVIGFQKADPTPAGLEEAGSTYLDGEVRLDLRRLSAHAAQALGDYLNDAGGDVLAAIDLALTDGGETRRRRMIERFAVLSPRVDGDSTDLIREDRDAH
jgi:hypothetical protein